MQFPNPYFLDADMNLAGPDLRLRTLNKDLTYRYDMVALDENDQEVPEEDRFQRMMRLSEHAKKDPWVKTQIYDSLTQISQYLIWEIFKKQKIDQMRTQDWGQHTGGMYSLLIKQRMTGKTTILTCHREDKKKKVDKTLEEIVIGYLPSIRPAIQEQLASFFTDVWNVELRQRPGGVYENWIQCTPTTFMPFLKNSMLMPSEVKAEWQEIRKYWPKDV